MHSGAAESVAEREGERDSVTCRDPSAAADLASPHFSNPPASQAVGSLLSAPNTKARARRAFSVRGGARSPERTRLSSICRVTGISSGNLAHTMVHRRTHRVRKLPGAREFPRTGAKRARTRTGNVLGENRETAAVPRSGSHAIDLDLAPTVARNARKDISACGERSRFSVRCVTRSRSRARHEFKRPNQPVFDRPVLQE